jgi:hypothetical protein
MCTLWAVILDLLKIYVIEPIVTLIVAKLGARYR